MNTFYYLSGVATATDARVFVDGARDGLVSTSQPLTSSTHPIFLGADRSVNVGLDSVPSGDYVDGIVDEIRFQTVARSDAWVAYDALAARGSGISYGPVIRP